MIYFPTGIGKWKDYWVTIDEDLAFGAWFWKFDDVDMATSLTFFLSTATLGLTKLKAKTLFVKVPVALVMLNVQDRGNRPSPEKPPWLVPPQPRVPPQSGVAALGGVCLQRSTAQSQVTWNLARMWVHERCIFWMFFWRKQKTHAVPVSQALWKVILSFFLHSGGSCLKT